MIVLWLVVMLLGAAEVTPMGTANILRLFDRYIPSNKTPIEIQSDPPPDLVVNDETPKWTSKVFEVEDVWSGDSGEATLKLQNMGDPGTLQLHLLNLVDEPGITPEPEPTPDLGELSQNLDILIWFDDGDNLYETGETKIAEDTLNNIACNIYGLGSLNSTETKYLGIAWSVDSAVGNEIMGDECTFDIQFAI